MPCCCRHREAARYQDDQARACEDKSGAQFHGAGAVCLCPKWTTIDGTIRPNIQTSEKNCIFQVMTSYPLGSNKQQCCPQGAVSPHANTLYGAAGWAMCWPPSVSSFSRASSLTTGW